MNEVVPINSGSTVLAELELIERVGLYKIKGYRVSEIAEVFEITQARVKHYLNEYNNILQKTLEDNPYFMEEVAQNTLRLLAELDELSKEAYETVEIATTNGLVGQRTQALKLALDIAGKRAALLQLAGGTKSDNSYLERTQKAEYVNGLLSRVIKDVVSDCDKCRERARVMLAEAFSLMEQEEEVDIVDEQ